MLKVWTSEVKFRYNNFRVIKVSKYMLCLKLLGEMTTPFPRPPYSETQCSADSTQKFQTAKHQDGGNLP